MAGRNARTISPFATTYTWNGSTSTVWTNPTNWTPTRSTIATSDVLVFNSGATHTVTGVPTETIEGLHVQGNTTVNLTPAGGVVAISIAGGPSPIDLEVASGSALNVTGGTAATNRLLITLGVSANGIISGSMTFSTAQHQLDAASASGITFNSGAVFAYNPGGVSGNAFTNGGQPNAIVFASGSQYLFQSGANPFGLAQPASKVVFQAGSVFIQTSTGTPVSSGRTYANFWLNNAAANITLTGGSAVSMDNLTITAGTLNFGMTATPGHAIKGHISVASGATLNFDPASAGTVNLNGSSAQTISGTGTISTNANSTIAITNAAGATLSSGATLTLGGAVTNSTAFTVNGTLKGTGTVSGAVVVNSRRHRRPGNQPGDP